MLLIVASRDDPTARHLAGSWKDYDCVRLTSADLSVAGWRFNPRDPAASMAVVDGRTFPTSEISAVVTRLPCVLEHELVEISRVDRAYVAAEMTAFLLSWLAALPCPIVNRPTATCLAGPYWRPERWALAAAQAGLRVWPLRRTAPWTASEDAVGVDDVETVTVVGDQVLGTTDEAATADALRLARLAGADLLAVRFGRRGSHAVFMGADIWPDLTAETIASAVIDHLGVAHRPSADAMTAPT